MAERIVLFGLLLLCLVHLPVRSAMGQGVERPAQLESPLSLEPRPSSLEAPAPETDEPAGTSLEALREDPSVGAEDPTPATGRRDDTRDLRFVVRAIAFRGNTRFSDDDLTRVAAPFLDRAIGAGDLQQLLVALTTTYVEAGYVNSGATLGDQFLEDGQLEVTIVEGRLGTIRIEGAQVYRPAVLVGRLEHQISSPLRVEDVERALRLLEGDPRIRRLDARLRPTETRGVADLVVGIEERSPYRARLRVANDGPTSVGTTAGDATLDHENVLGFGDVFRNDVTVTEGLWRIEAGYDIPVHASGTTIGAAFRYSEAEIVEPPFDLLEIESETRTIAIRLRQPILRDRRHDLWLGLGAEHREGRTTLLGRGFSFTRGADNGRTRLAVLRPSLEWTIRGNRMALAIRSLASFGIDLPGVTTKRPGVADARFVSWLLQAHGLWRSPTGKLEVAARFDLQLSDDPLLPLERFPIGGAASVRGYRRNTFVRDQGLVGGLELRWPAWRSTTGRRLLEFSVFADTGQAWNRDRADRARRTLASLGASIVARPLPGLRIDLGWGLPLIDERGGDSLQGRGLHLAAEWEFR